VKLWDVRAGPQCSMSLDHGAPVEDVAFFPSGGLLVSAGGTSLCVWDLIRYVLCAACLVRLCCFLVAEPDVGGRKGSGC
jgi:WD40 repeat protein